MSPSLQSPFVHYISSSLLLLLCLGVFSSLPSNVQHNFIRRAFYDEEDTHCNICTFVKYAAFARTIELIFNNIQYTIMTMNFFSCFVLCSKSIKYFVFGAAVATCGAGAATVATGVAIVVSFQLFGVGWHIVIKSCYCITMTSN